ncbi:phosphoenolpyruvate carboxylase 4-like isoform X2 [Vicia villosa]|uniref:phosphoenolpyruvate carboxylase 4-like isoform X2 n=1 Tax=Vicia villosa TaxID=3911 RepID=UPI00273B9A42|nr:phosphoenolpyruvate carboxylase 4-like isoform X2 [Vicia villosa]
MVIEDLVREITSIWQTDELRRQKPTPVDEARAGLNIVEQSLWKAVPHYLRRVSNALKKQMVNLIIQDSTFRDLITNNSITRMVRLQLQM